MTEASSTDDVITLRIRFKSETLDKFIEKYGVDLSPSEVFVRTREPLDVGTPLAFDFSLHDGTPLIAGRGTVAWVRGQNAAEPGPPGMGIAFEELTPESSEMLSQILDERAKREQVTGAPSPAASARFTAPLMEAVRDIPGAKPRFEPFGGPASPVATPVDSKGPRSEPISAKATPASSPAVSSSKPTVSTPAVGAKNGPSLDDAFADLGSAQDIADLPAGGAPSGPGGKRPGWGDDSEKTEIARVPPSFYYNAAEEQSTQSISVNDAITEDAEETTKPRAEQPQPPPGRQPPVARPVSAPSAPARVPSGQYPPVSVDGPSSAPTASASGNAWPPPAGARLSTPMGLNIPSGPSGGPLQDMRPQPLSPGPGQGDAGAFEMPWAPGAESAAPARPTRSNKTVALVMVVVVAAALGVAGLYFGPRLMKKPVPAGTVPPAPTPTVEPLPAPGAPSGSAPAAPSGSAPAAPAGAAPSGSAPAAPAGGAAAPAATPPAGGAAPGEAAPAAAPAHPDEAKEPAKPEAKPETKPETKSEGKPGARPAARPAAARPAARRTASEVIAAAQARDNAESAGTAGEVFFLQVRSTPPGADVLIDGQPEGKTPFQRRIFDSGRSYHITIKKAGYEAEERHAGPGDDWAKSGNTRTLTVSAALKAVAGAAEPEPKREATEPPAGTTPAERKSNPFDEPK